MAGAEWGIRMEPSQFHDAIRAIGRIPVERTTTYERVHRNGSEAPGIAPPGALIAPSRA
jgi:2-iminoacetate synthase ThiH